MEAKTVNLQEMLAKVGDLPTMPQIAVKVTELINDEKTSARLLQEVIQSDIALSAKILKMANSAFYGGRKSTTLVEAIMVLGFQTLKSIVLATSTSTLFTGGRSLKDELLWEHSLGCAIGARMISEKMRFPGKEKAFISGLMHDIGKTILSQRMAQAYDQIIQKVYEEGMDATSLEREAFGFDHTEVGMAIAAQWNFPTELQEAIRLHHFPEKATESPLLAAIVALANDLCIKAGIGPESREGFGPAGMKAIEILKLNDTNFALWELELQEALTEQKTFLR